MSVSSMWDTFISFVTIGVSVHVPLQQNGASVRGRIYCTICITTILKVRRLVGSSTESFLLLTFITGTNGCLKHAVVQLGSIKYQWRLS